MKKYLLVMMIFLSITLQAFEERVVAKFASDEITQSMVEAFIEDNLLSDQMKISLFVRANRDYKTYQKEKALWLKDNFQEGLKHFLYTHLLYVDYLMYDSAKPELFRMNTSDAYMQINSIENKALAPYLAKGEGVKVARELFGKSLMNQNYPHQVNQNPEELFWEWYKGEERKINQKDRLASADRWEFLRATQERDKISVEAWHKTDFYKQTKKELEEKLVGKSLTLDEYSRIIKEHPEFQVITSKMNLLSAHELPFSVIKSERADQDLLNKLDQVLSEQELKKFLNYEEKAFLLSQKYQNSAELKQLAKEQRDRFFTNEGDYSHYMLSKLYGIAAQIALENPDRTNLREQLMIQLTSIVTDLKKKLKSGEIFEKESYRKLTLEALVGNYLKDGLAKSSSLPLVEASYLVQTIDMIIWSAQFQVKKMVDGSKQQVAVEILPLLNTETFKRITSYLEHKKVASYLEELKQNEFLHRYSNLITIFDEYPIRGLPAINFVLGN